MHSKGIVHRDIKPANIFFEDNNQYNHIKIGNFSEARTYPDKIIAGMIKEIEC